MPQSKERLLRASPNLLRSTCTSLLRTSASSSLLHTCTCTCSSLLPSASSCLLCTSACSCLLPTSTNLLRTSCEEEVWPVFTFGQPQGSQERLLLQLDIALFVSLCRNQSELPLDARFVVSWPPYLTPNATAKTFVPRLPPPQARRSPDRSSLAEALVATAAKRWFVPRDAPPNHGGVWRRREASFNLRFSRWRVPASVDQCKARRPIPAENT